MAEKQNEEQKGGWQRLRVPLLIVALGLVVLIGGALSLRATAQDISRPQIDLSPLAYVQSQQCQSCHPAQYASWFQTFHRTMTQAATPVSVLADFDNARYTFQGVTSRFLFENNNYFIETLGEDGEMTRYPIVLTVGSRRIQQYVMESTDGSHWRVPLAWDIEQKHWFHLNGGFLHPDGSDFNEHLAIWDANCIFCHNTRAMPGLDWTLGTFDADVEELGIACEACHGPGEKHVSVNSNPLRRYWLYLTEPEKLRDPTLISPAELDPLRSVQICGHCHGQRIPDPPTKIRTMMSDGDPYTVGDDLRDHYAPITIDSTLPGIDLSLRFWQDGTPRLTAYEYQGWLMSEHQETGLTCISCHNMHGGDPKGMIDPPLRGDVGCTQCHTEIDEVSHSKHAAASTTCYDCHMPKSTYGVLEIHPSHRITNPDPSRAWRYEMPEACTLCHSNESALWAAEQVSRQYGIEPIDWPADPEFAIAENVRALLSGDVVQRSVAAMAFSDAATYSDRPQDRLWALPFLIVTMERDSYPAIRGFAYRSLQRLANEAGLTLEQLPPFDNLAEAEARAEVVERYRQWYDALDKQSWGHPGAAALLTADFALDVATVERLLAGQDDTLISIGE